jgi:hypothetical protein
MWTLSPQLLLRQVECSLRKHGDPRHAHPLLTMARKLLEAGTDPNTELRLVPAALRRWPCGLRLPMQPS